MTLADCKRSSPDLWFMPDESTKHRRTWMAFGPSEKIWGDLLPDIRANLALLAKTILEFEPVTMLVRPEDRMIAAQLCGECVELIEAPLDDLWIRDTGPVFVVNSAGKLGAVDLNFNGWGTKQAHKNDAKVARFVAEKSGAAYMKSVLGWRRRRHRSRWAREPRSLPRAASSTRTEIPSLTMLNANRS